MEQPAPQFSARGPAAACRRRCPGGDFRVCRQFRSGFAPAGLIGKGEEAVQVGVFLQ